LEDGVATFSAATTTAEQQAPFAALTAGTALGITR
jgi:hypothetical protein